jgi:hypothetical protein
MKKIVVVITTLIIYGHSLAQEVNWGKSSHWTIYNIRNSHAFFWPQDTLKNFTSLALEDPIIHSLLIKPIMMKNEEPEWMGMYVATCKTADGTLHKIDVSVYGGFFLDEKLHKYFQVTEAYRDTWLTYFHDAMAKLDDPKK